jgi:uncharacterized membrane protein (DUF106 family)
MTLVNALLNRTFDLLLSPLRPLSPVASLSILSLVTAIAILVVVRVTSNQRAIAEVKRQIHADLFEIRLFNDDLRAMLRAQGDLLRDNATYLRLSLVPMAWTVVPFILAIAQLQSHFGYSGIAIGQSFLIAAQLKSPDAPRDAGAAPEPTDAETNGQPTVLETPPGIRVETPAVWFPALQQAVWRVVAEKPGDYTVRLRVGGDSYEKTLHVSSDGPARRSPVRRARGLLQEVLYPSEAPLPDSAPLTSISVSYPERDIYLFGWQLHWMTVYLVESMAFALALKTPLRVNL